MVSRRPSETRFRREPHETRICHVYPSWSFEWAQIPASTPSTLHWALRNQTCFKCRGFSCGHILIPESRETKCVFVSVWVCVCLCVAISVCVFTSACAFHCHAKDKQACPVPSGAKPAGCRSCFCFVPGSVFSPRHIVVKSLSLPLSVCVSVCVCVCLSRPWPWCEEKTRNTSRPTGEQLRELEIRCCLVCLLVLFNVWHCICV